MSLKKSIREGAGCRLCWRITFAVFALILVAEVAVLVPSLYRFQRVERERIASRAQAGIENFLLRAGGTRGHAQETELSDLARQLGLGSASSLRSLFSS